MKKKIKKSSLILKLLVIAFFAVSISYALDISPYTISPQPPIEIEEHTDVPITHGGDQWPYSCTKCHYEPLYGECTDCHTPDYWIGDDDGTYMAHHDLSYTGFIDCWSVDCHNPDPNDVRFVETDLVEGDDWHEFCDNCHDGGDHG
ncbi:MAG: hypothetical protein AYK22_03675 [Thermoplasmatales archaeon SG8-52-3]|nr:MAG: hypothetical protein AYK22_03675 [Thermoplasmatales archaeon SG8-52-3]